MALATLSSGWISTELWKQFSKEKTTAHRLFSSGSVSVERFGEDVLISRVSQVSLDAMMQELDDWGHAHNFIPRRIYRRELVKGPDASNTPILIHGDSKLPPQSIVQEFGINYEVDFSVGYSVGFFMDQRLNRQHLHSLKLSSLLNCFAYTCSFSVVAASIGAQTTSIDLARKALERGKHNFELNQFSLDGHSFHVGDVREWFRRFARKKVKFDVIILDPPTFSRNRDGDVFQIEKDMSDLISNTVACLAPEGSALLSTNCSSLNNHNLMDLAKLELRKVNKQASFKSLPIPADIPEESAPSSVWMKME